MFFQKKMDNDNRGMNEVNMTPLIDVSLVLVVMLMLATPLAFESSIAVRKSASSARAAEKQSVEERIEIRLISEEEVHLNSATVEREHLVGKLRPLVNASEHRLVVVACDNGVSHGAFVDVLDKAKLSGAKDIAITGR